MTAGFKEQGSCRVWAVPHVTGVSWAALLPYSKVKGAMFGTLHRQRSSGCCWTPCVWLETVNQSANTPNCPSAQYLREGLSVENNLRHPHIHWENFKLAGCSPILHFQTCFQSSHVAETPKSFRSAVLYRAWSDCCAAAPSRGGFRFAFHKKEKASKGKALKKILYMKSKWLNQQSE